MTVFSSARFSRLVARTLFVALPMVVLPDLCAMDYQCGGPANVRELSDPYEIKATRIAGESDLQLSNRVKRDLESIWAVIPDCPECPVAGACTSKAEMQYTSYDVMPNPEEPEVIVRYHGGEVHLSCTNCPDLPE